MKNYCFTLIIGACFWGNAHGQTVEEMYLSIPSSILGQLGSPDEPSNKTIAAMKNLIAVKDLKNGYLKTKGGVEIVKFTRKGNSPILAVAGGSYAEDGRNFRLQFFVKNKNGSWSEITKQYFTAIPDMVIDALARKKCRLGSDLSDSASGTYRYELPRNGKTIQAFIESDLMPSCKKSLFSLVFDGSKLRMKI